MAAELSQAFQSARLVFTAIDDTEETKAWFHTQIKNDPVGLALGDSNVLRPQTRARSDSILAAIRADLLGVLICLRPTADAAQQQPPTPVGVLHLDDEAGGGYRHHHRLAVLSVSVVAAHRDRGYGAEAINWALDWAFVRANMHAVSLGCVEYNARGRHLYEKVGFVEEGRLRKCHWHERKWWDVVMYSMLEEEWLALRGREEVKRMGNE